MFDKEWRVYLELPYAHFKVGDRIDFNTREPIVDETACGILVDIRNYSYQVVPNIEEAELCKKCEDAYKYRLMDELSG